MNNDVESTAKQLQAYCFVSDETAQRPDFTDMTNKLTVNFAGRRKVSSHFL